jgi:hypothetical protein
MYSKLFTQNVELAQSAIPLKLNTKYHPSYIQTLLQVSCTLEFKLSFYGLNIGRAIIADRVDLFGHGIKNKIGQCIVVQDLA